MNTRKIRNKRTQNLKCFGRRIMILSFSFTAIMCASQKRTSKLEVVYQPEEQYKKSKTEARQRLTRLKECYSTLKEWKQRAETIKDFLGQWTLDIEEGYVGWIDIRQEEGCLDADILWKWGSISPVANVYFEDDSTLILSRNYDMKLEDLERQHTINHRFIINVKDTILKGISVEPNKDGKGVVKTKFTGRKLPPMQPAPDLSTILLGKPVSLFNGVDLSGWERVDPSLPNGFKVEDGILFNDPAQKEGQPFIQYASIKTIQKFEDFNLTLEVKIPEKSNSGIYLRGLYEIQIRDTYGQQLDSHNMGAVYSRITPSVLAEKKAGEWQTLDITLFNRHINVVLNGVTIINNQPVSGPTGGAISSDVFSEGPIFLQGDHGKVWFRKMILKPIIK